MQGFGNAGAHFACLAHAAGYKVVAVSDSKAAIHSPDGLKPGPLLDYKRREKELSGAIYAESSVKEPNGDEEISHAELLALDVDVLVLAAMEDAVTGENARDVKAPVILEIANGPISQKGDEILNEMGKIVIPDVLANAGGVTVSHIEWIQSRTGDYWSGGQVKERLAQKMEDASRRTFDRAEADGVTLREAAYSVAVERIARAVSSRGDQSYFSR